MEELIKRLQPYEVTEEILNSYSYDELKSKKEELDAIRESVVNKYNESTLALFKSLFSSIIKQEWEVEFSGVSYAAVSFNIKDTRYGVGIALNEDIEDMTENAFKIYADGSINEFDVYHMNEYKLDIINVIHAFVNSKSIQDALYENFQNYKEELRLVRSIRRTYFEVMCEIEKTQREADRIIKHNTKYDEFHAALMDLKCYPEQLRLIIYNDDSNFKNGEKHYIYRGKPCMICPTDQGMWYRDYKGQRNTEESMSYKKMWAMADNLKYQDGKPVFP